MLSNLSALIAHLHFPVEHRERIRHSNLLERTFGETRRRVKVIGRLPGEHSCLSLVWAVLDRASVGAASRPRSPASASCRISAVSCWVRPSSAPPAERLPSASMTQLRTGPTETSAAEVLGYSATLPGALHVALRDSVRRPDRPERPRWPY